jgi:hypothetical protein
VAAAPGRAVGAGVLSARAGVGTLTFATALPPGANVELRILGLPEEVVGEWTAP